MYQSLIMNDIYIRHMDNFLISGLSCQQPNINYEKCEYQQLILKREYAG